MKLASSSVANPFLFVLYVILFFNVKEVVKIFGSYGVLVVVVLFLSILIVNILSITKETILIDDEAICYKLKWCEGVVRFDGLRVMQIDKRAKMLTIETDTSKQMFDLCRFSDKEVRNLETYVDEIFKNQRRQTRQ